MELSALIEPVPARDVKDADAQMGGDSIALPKWHQESQIASVFWEFAVAGS
jgi:hypothetical protein